MRIKRLQIPETQSESNIIDISLLDEIIQKYKGQKGNLIPLLQAAMSIYGYLPQEVFDKYENDLGLSKSQMYGVATFYAQFRLKPVGKHIIKVCHGTACHVQNAVELSEAISESLEIKDGETSADGLFTLESVACLGCCSLAPVMMIGDEVFGKLNGKAANKIINKIKLDENL